MKKKTSDVIGVLGLLALSIWALNNPKFTKEVLKFVKEDVKKGSRYPEDPARDRKKSDIVLHEDVNKNWVYTEPS